MAPHDSVQYSTTWQILQHYRESVIFEDSEDLIMSEPAPPMPPLYHQSDQRKPASQGRMNYGSEAPRGRYNLTPETLSPVTPPRSASPDDGYASSHTSTSSNYAGERKPREIRERRSPKGTRSQHWPLNLKLSRTNGSTQLDHKDLPKWKEPPHQQGEASPTQAPPIPLKNARRSMEGLPSQPYPDRSVGLPGRTTGLRQASRDESSESLRAGKRWNGPPLKVDIPSHRGEPPVRMDSINSSATRDVGKRRPSNSRPAAMDSYARVPGQSHKRQQESYGSTFSNDAPDFQRNYSIDSYGDGRPPAGNNLSNLIASGLRSASDYGESARVSPSSAYTDKRSNLDSGRSFKAGMAYHTRNETEDSITFANLATPFSQPEIISKYNPSYDASVLSPPSAGPRQSFGFKEPLKFPNYDINSPRKQGMRPESDVISPRGTGPKSAAAELEPGVLSPTPLRAGRRAPSFTRDPVEKVVYGSIPRSDSETLPRQRQGSPPPPPPPPKPAGLPSGPKSMRGAASGPPPLPRKDTVRVSKGPPPVSTANSKIESVRAKLGGSSNRGPSGPRAARPEQGLADVFDLANSPSPGSEAPRPPPHTSRHSPSPDSAQRFFQGGFDERSNRSSDKPLPSTNGYGELNPFAGPSPRHLNPSSANRFASPGFQPAPHSSKPGNGNQYAFSPASSSNFGEGGPGPTAPSSAVSPAFRSGNNLAVPPASAFLSPASAAFTPAEPPRSSPSPRSPLPAAPVTRSHLNCPSSHKRQAPESNHAAPTRCMACWANPTRFWRCDDCGLGVCSSCRGKLGRARGDLNALLDLTNADRNDNMASPRQIVDPEDAKRMPAQLPLSAGGRPRANTGGSPYSGYGGDGGRYGSRTPVSARAAGSPFHSQSNSMNSGFSNYERTYSGISNASSNSSLPVGASAFGRLSSGSAAQPPPQQQPKPPPSAGFNRAPLNSPGMAPLSEGLSPGYGPYPGSRPFPPKAPSSGMANIRVRSPTSYPSMQPPPINSAQPSPRMAASSPGLRIRSLGSRSPGLAAMNMGGALASPASYGGAATPRTHRRMGSANLRDGMEDPSAAALAVGAGPYPGSTQSRSMPAGPPGGEASQQVPMPPRAPRGLPMGGPRPGGPRKVAGGGVGGPLPPVGPAPPAGRGGMPPPMVPNGRSLPPGAGFGLPGVPKNVRAGVPGRPTGTMRIGF